MKSDFNKKLISHIPVGYGLHKIKLNKANQPVDYVFLDVNHYFEKYTGLRREDVLGKTVLEVIPTLLDGDFDWIEYYGKIATEGTEGDFIQYSNSLQRTYKVHVYSPEPNYFITLFTDHTIEEERERILRNIIRQAPVPIMIHAEDGEVLHISDSWKDISGYKLEDIPTINEWTKNAYGTKQQEVSDFIEKLYILDESQHDGEFEVVAKDGSKLLWDFYSTYLGKSEDGKRIAMSVALDVTKKDKLEKELLHEKQTMEATLLSIGDGVITTDRDGIVTLLNGVAEELTGWRKEDAIGKPIEQIFEIYNDVTKQKIRNILNSVVNEKKTKNLANSTMLQSKDGTSRPISDGASPIINEQNDVIGVVIVFQDYTEKYQQQVRQRELIDELDNTKLMLQSSLDSPKDLLILSLDTEYRYLYFNEAHANSMKYAYNSEVKIGDCIFDHMTSQEEIDALKKNYDVALSGQSFMVTEVYGDKVPKHYEIRFNPIFDRNHNVWGLTVFAEDVTRQVEMKRQIAYQEDVTNTYFEITTQLLVVLDEQAVITLINDSGCDLLEDTKENIIGLNWFEHFIPGTITDEIMKVFHDTFRTGFDEYSKYTNDIQTAKGNIKTIAWNNTLLRNEKGNVISVLCCGEDITDRIAYEKKLIQISNTDSLTGLYNRRYYEKALLELDRDEYLPLSIIVSDINGLKLINDAFGHGNGDRLLIETAKVFQESVPDTAVICRIGGDEFAILCPNSTIEQAQMMIHKINERAAQVQIQGIELSISSGIDVKKDAIQKLSQICRSAEDRMYRTKLLEIPSMRSSTIETILATLHEKDQYSRNHSQNVATYCQRFAKVLGYTSTEMKELYSIGLLHDIGKIIIPNNILNKRGKLSEEEYYEVKKHSEIGFRILNSTKDLRDISNIVLHHHEWWNGEGYPEQISKKDIPQQSRVLCIVDAFDAMTSNRTYREKYTTEQAIKELQKYAGIQFDPDLVASFVEHIHEILTD